MSESPLDPSAERSVSERDWLASAGIRPRKRFGQNFLLDTRIPEMIVSRAGWVSGTPILEIGPGSGALTRALLAAGHPVLCVEMDRDLVQLLRRRFAAEIESGQLIVREGDALDLDRGVIDELAAMASDRTKELATAPGAKAVPATPAPGVGDAKTMPATPAAGVGDAKTMPVTPAAGVDDAKTMPATPAAGVDDAKTMPATPAPGVDDAKTMPVTPAPVVTDAQVLSAVRPWVAGNLPYTITTPLLLWCYENSRELGGAVVMVQREYGDRLLAEVGTRDYSSITVWTRAHAEPRSLLRVGRSSFWPRPGVESVVMELRFPDPPPYRGERESLQKILRAAFGQRRKMLQNTLASGLGIEKAEAIDLVNRADCDPTARAETLDLEHFSRLVAAWSRSVG